MVRCTGWVSQLYGYPELSDSWERPHHIWKRCTGLTGTALFPGPSSLPRSTPGELEVGCAVTGTYSREGDAIDHEAGELPSQILLALEVLKGLCWSQC